MHPVGFEPTPPKRTELESVALDHSATDAIITWLALRIGLSLHFITIINTNILALIDFIRFNYKYTTNDSRFAYGTVRMT